MRSEGIQHRAVRLQQRSTVSWIRAEKLPSMIVSAKTLSGGQKDVFSVSYIVACPVNISMIRVPYNFCSLKKLKRSSTNAVKKRIKLQALMFQRSGITAAPKSAILEIFGKTV
jgi:hypothetical protein